MQWLDLGMAEQNDIGDRYGFRKIIDERNVKMRMAVENFVFEILMHKEEWKAAITMAVQGGNTTCDVRVYHLGVIWIIAKI